MTNILNSPEVSYVLNKHLSEYYAEEVLLRERVDKLKTEYANTDNVDDQIVLLMSFINEPEIYKLSQLDTVNIPQILTSASVNLLKAFNIIYACDSTSIIDDAATLMAKYIKDDDLVGATQDITNMYVIGKSLVDVKTAFRTGFWTPQRYDFDTAVKNADFDEIENRLIILFKASKIYLD